MSLGFSLIAAALFAIPSGDNASTNKNARITSLCGDFDRNAGVVLFEKDVHIEYDKDYELFADQLFVFLENTNQLSKIVACGNVSVINNSKAGKCHMAKFNRKTNQIDMYGSGEDALAKLIDGNTGNELNGGVIHFWLDSEQVEVEKSEVFIRQKPPKESVL